MSCKNSVIDNYNKLPNKDRNQYELEIRYVNTSLSKTLLAELINMGISKYNATDISFIDTLSYINENLKIGMRTKVENKTTTTSEYFKKETMDSYRSSNSIGKYSIFLAKELPVSKEEVPTNLSVVLLKRRFSFFISEEKNWRYDISIIRKTEPSSMCIKTAFREFFIEYSDINILLKSISEKSFIYSINLEIEYVDKKNIVYESLDNILRLPFLMNNPKIEDVIKFQQEVLYISNTINQLSNNYIKKNNTDNLQLKNILPQVKSFTKHQYFEIYPPINYFLKEKTDGNRCIVSIRNSIVSIIWDIQNIKQYDIKYSKNIIVDCEIIKEKINVFDVILYNDEDIFNLPFEKRVLYISKCCDILNKFIKGYEFIEGDYVSLSNPIKYKKQFEDKYNNSQFTVDGLILLKKGDNYKNTITYKWKPTKYQTIDALCKRCPDHLIKKGSYPTKDKHTLYFLYVTASKNLIHNLNLTTNIGYNDIFNIEPSYNNIPIPFSTPFVPLSYIYFHPEEEDDIDDIICEFTCSDNCIEHDTVHNRFLVNWKLLKRRLDKNITPGINYGNNYATALYSFLNHINTFDISYLYNGIPEDVYFQNKGGESNVYSSMRSFSNYVKTQLINEYAHKTQSVIDIGSGRGGDLYKYIQQNLVQNLIVLDKDKTALSELMTRWIDIGRTSNIILKTSIRGMIMDINDNYTDNVNMIKSLSDTTYVNTIFCHSALHYFCESVESVRNFVSFCKELTRSGSKVVITCPNGESIFKLLQNSIQWNSVENNSIKYEINKLYSDKVMTEGGQKISVLLPFSKGKTYPEYLINSKVLIQIFKEANFSLLLRKGYSSYLESFRVYKQAKYEGLTDSDKEWSSLFQVLVFKRK